MKRRTLALILTLVTIFVGGIFFWANRKSDQLQIPISSAQSDNTPADTILYYGQECPHCKKVDKFIKDNQLELKVIFDKKETWHNAANSSEFQEKIKECALDPAKVGVPFLFARGKCYVGEIEVQNFFKKEAGM